VRFLAIGTLRGLLILTKKKIYKVQRQLQVVRDDLKQPTSDALTTETE